MERQRTSSLFISGFVLITVLYFIPSCPAARLLYSPPQNSPVGEGPGHNQSKSGAKPSISDHSGSANGDAPPSVPPPPSFETTYETVRNVSQSPPVTAVGQNNVTEQQYTSPPPPAPSSYSGTCAYERYDSYGNRHIIITRCNISYQPPPPPEYEGNGDYP
ncbi:uncharacterized protein LOC123214952 [Mangifera indica]|uniref:uncharacterized protein LOC123214952 n=1 Tax=Mangifera indica TaxID=29780 RepID=UPI001CFB94BC|nr:uncharacterized protein LOC123214952 [Mangifera indica]